MGIINRGANDVPIDIAREQSAKLVQKAIDAGASMTLRCGASGAEGAMAVFIVDATDDTLFVEAGRPPAASFSQGAALASSLLLDGTRYGFATTLLDVREGPKTVHLRITRPSVLQTWQRRRFIRATVADSAAVAICLPDDFDMVRCEGQVLNVSKDGLACLVDTAAAGRHRIGELVGVSFALARESRPLRLVAEIRSMTPGGTTGKTILGMQFDTTGRSGAEQADLADALEAYL